MTQEPTPPSGSAAPDGSATPSAAPASAITIRRTGGIAGVHDVVEIAADGSVQVMQKTGVGGSCTPTAAALDQLRAIDLAAIASGGPKEPIRDGFSYQIVTALGTASVGDGDEGPRGELLRAASEVVRSCLATVSSSGLTY